MNVACWMQVLRSLPAGALPLQRAFIKAQLDHLTAEVGWRQAGRDVREG